MGKTIPQHDESLTYECPHCHSSIDVLENLLGQMIECPVCDKPFMVQPPNGRPLSPSEARSGGRHAVVTGPADDEHVEWVVHPVILRSHFLATLACFVIAVCGVIGLVLALAGSTFFQIPALWMLVGSVVMLLVGGFFLLKWYIASRMHSLTLTSERLIYRYGIIRRGTSEMRYDDVRNLQIDQNFVERMLGYGDLAVSSSGQDEMEIIINDIPRPGEVAEHIRQRQ